MKYPGPHVPRAASLKLTRNPTSTTTTIYQYAILLYLSLSYILRDLPQHVQYHEKRKQNQAPTSDLGSCKSPSTNTQKSTARSQDPPGHRNSDKHHETPYSSHSPQAEATQYNGHPSCHTHPVTPQHKDTYLDIPNPK